MKQAAIIAGCWLLFVAGCDMKLQPSREFILETENQKLTSEVNDLKVQNKELTQQVAALQSVDGSTRISALSKTKSVHIHKFTDMFDKDNDEFKETLVVYVQPKDTEYDVVKMPGEITLEAWDLQLPQENALLKKWHIPGEELKENWSTSFGSGYRLQFPMLEELQTAKGPILTIKVEFLDYVTGETFRDQKTIEMN